MGHPLKPLAELPTEELRIVLTRPLVSAHSKAILEVITVLSVQSEGRHADIDLGEKG